MTVKPASETVPPICVRYCNGPNAALRLSPVQRPISSVDLVRAPTRSRSAASQPCCRFRPRCSFRLRTRTYGYRGLRRCVEACPRYADLVHLPDQTKRLTQWPLADLGSADRRESFRWRFIQSPAHGEIAWIALRRTQRSRNCMQNSERQSYRHGTPANMTKPKSQICEVKIGSEWRAVSLTDAAVAHAKAVKRCPACNGRVTVLGAYSWPTVRRTMSHRKSHSGCPLMLGTYSGTPSPHPQALT